MDPITELVMQRDRLPESIDDFKIASVLPESGLSDGARLYQERFKPYLEAVDWKNTVRGTASHRKQFETTYKVITAALLANIPKLPRSELQKEATQAGTDIPTFTKLLIRTVLRAYPQMLTPQLFPVVPLTAGPDGRIYLPLTKYDSAFASSSPSINAGDVTADLDKFNSEFFKQTAQLENTGLMKIDWSNYITVSADTYAVTAISSLQGEQDFSTIYGQDFNATISEVMAHHLQWAIDRKMITAAQAAVPTANKVTWKRAPTINSVTFANQLPSERQAWRETIWHDGFLPIFTAIYNRYYVRPNWVIAAPDVAEDISRVSSFKPIQVDTSVIDVRQGAIRDIGTVDNGGIRVLVDPQYTTGKALFGYRPTMATEPAIVFCPYRAIGFVDPLTYPRSLKRERAAYTRFAIGKPDNTVAESASLGNVYGELTVSNAA